MKSNELEQVARGREATCYVDVCIVIKTEATRTHEVTRLSRRYRESQLLTHNIICSD